MTCIVLKKVAYQSVVSASNDKCTSKMLALQLVAKKSRLEACSGHFII